MMRKSNSTSPSLPLKVRAALAIMSIGSDVCRLNNTIKRFFSDFFVWKVPSYPDVPFMGVNTVDVIVDSGKTLWFRLFSPSPDMKKKTDNTPVIFFFHGGGFVFMSPANMYYDNFCRLLVRELDAVVISVNYRLAPDHRWPCQYEDCLDVIRYVDENSIPGSPGNLKYSFLAGDSAGGNIAHHVALKASEHEFSKVKLIGVVSIQPFFGGEERTASEVELTMDAIVRTYRTDWMWKCFLPEGSNRNHPACNVLGPNSAGISAVRFPPTIVFIGELDPLKDRQKSYCDAMKVAGKEVSQVEYHSIHCFYLFPELPESSQLMRDVKIFVEKQISSY